MEQRDGEMGGPVMRVFEARAKPGCADELLRKFTVTSADVVQNEPGNIGYFFGRDVHDDQIVVFTSLWKDMTSIRQRFGEEWQASFLPEGYAALISEHSIRHIDLTDGWRV